MVEKRNSRLWKNRTSVMVDGILYRNLVSPMAKRILLMFILLVCGSAFAVIPETATLTVKFPGQSSVHTSVFVTDEVDGTASGIKITHANWKRNQAVISVPTQVIDLSIVRGGATHIVDNVDCTSGECVVDSLTSILTVDFPGQSSVHTSVLVADGVSGTATGAKVTHANWKRNQAIINVFPQVFDLSIAKGGIIHIVDDVDCTSGECKVDGLTSILTVNFPGQSSVHTSVLVADGVAGTASGVKVTHANWKRNQAVINVFPQVFDLAIKKGGITHIVDDVDCTSGECNVDGLTSILTVNFPGQSSIHTSVFVADGVAGTASGAKVTHANWKKNQAVVSVFPQVFDLSIRKGGITHIVDDVDCTSGECNVDGLTSILTVNFPGQSSVHTSVFVADGVKGIASGAKVTRANWKRDKAIINVLPAVFDLTIKKGGTTQIVDDVDCTSGECTVGDLTANLTVNFPGQSSVHTSVFVADGVNGIASGLKVTHANWKKDQAIFSVPTQIFDLSIVKGGATHIVDDVDCTSGDCIVDGLSSTLTVNFPGQSSVHTSVFIADGTQGVVSGEKVTHANWKRDQAVITLFPQIFDLVVTKGGATHVVDDVDCTSGVCTVDGLTSLLTVSFPGQSSVHTSVFIADGKGGEVTGAKVTHANWKKDRAAIEVFPQVFDLIVTKGAATHILDNVDCSSGECNVEGLTSILTVNFPGQSSVHTSVMVTDGVSGTATGGKVTHANWKKDQAILSVFPQVFDLSITKGGITLVIDDVDCTSGECTVNGLTSILTVNFEGLSSVHTSVFVADGVDGTASGDKVTHANWKNDQAVINVLPQVFDVSITKGAATYIVDDVDCTSGICIVDDITVELSVEFPGLSSVHTAVQIPDGVTGTAEGELVTHSNWKSQKTDIIVLRQLYDISVFHGVMTVFDDVDCTSGSCDVVVLGNAQITVVDGDNNNPISDQYIQAYLKSSNGDLVKVQKGVTNENGNANFSLEGLGSGNIYVLFVQNAFGNNKKYYSPLLTAEGPFEFRITRDGEYPLDLTPPEISITTPVDGHSVILQGFTVVGFATDNNQIETVELTVDDPIKGKTTLVGQYDQGTGGWSAIVTAAMISENGNIILTAIATDRALNQTSQQITVTAIFDTQGPQITIMSHANNDTVPVTGFLLSGSVTDETTVQGLFATLVDPIKGNSIDNQAVDFASNSGAWTLVISNGSISENNLIEITVTAVDEVNNSSNISINLLVTSADNSGRHIINRTTFGATPQLLVDVTDLGPLTFLDQQLNPDSIDDSEFDSLLGSFLPTTKEELKIYSSMHMVHSNRQLKEVMTLFWDNHFNTDIDKPGNDVTFELAENQQFRINALGNFRDLLEISAKSPAMLYYLDNVKNFESDANENYAREVLELHTMGVDGGYTSADVEALAEIFTGWTVDNSMFFFDADEHNFDQQVFLNNVISSGGVEQGEQFMDIVAVHRSTAEFISTKLVTLFVNDTPPDSLVMRTADIFQSASNDSDQIAQVVREILTSPEFAESYRTKIKSPIELVVGLVRNLSGKGTGDDLPVALLPMGMNLFENPVPTGYSEKGADWINSNVLLERIKWVNKIAINSQVGDDTYLMLVDFFKNNGFETNDGIVGYLMELVFGDDFTQLDQDIAMEILAEGGEFQLSSPDAEDKLRQLIGTVFSYPQYQYQ